MHRIITAEVSYEHPYVGEDVARSRGFTVAIEPPVQLEADIVNRALGTGTIGNPARNFKNPFTKVSLIGSTEERTVIYARLFTETDDRKSLNETRELLCQRTTNLLGLLGINGFEYDQEIPPLTDLI